MKKVWDSVFYAMVWPIWKVKNGQIFHEETVHLEQIPSFIKFRVDYWIRSIMGRQIHV